MARLQKAFVSNYTASYLKADKWIIETRKIKWFRAINRLSWHVYATDNLKRLSPILAAFRGSPTLKNRAAIVLNAFPNTQPAQSIPLSK